MMDGKSSGGGGSRHQEPSNSSHGTHSSKLPRLGRRCHEDPVKTTDSNFKPGLRKNTHPTNSTNDSRSTPSRGHKREISASSSIASQDSSDSSTLRTSPRTSKTPTSKACTPRTTSDIHSRPSPVDNRNSPLKDSITAARAVLPGPNTTSHIPRAPISKGGPTYQASRYRDLKAKEATKMNNASEGEKSPNGESGFGEISETQKPISENSENGGLNGKAGPKLADADKSTNGDHESTVNGVENTADVDTTDGISYASALKSGLNGQETDGSPTRRGPHLQDDDDSYPELDDMTLDEIHPPPKVNSDGGIRWAPWNIPLKRRLQTLVVLMHCMSIALTVSIFFALSANPFVWPLLLLYLLHVLSSKAATDGSLKFRSEWFRKSYMWHLFASYFPAKLHKTHDLPPTRKYIFGYHPHGIISHGAWAAFGTDALGFSEKFPGITNSLLTLDSNFRIPLYREYILAAGVRSVSKESIVNILTRGGPNGEGMGRGVTIVIGGARESLEAQPGQLRLILKERKGFVKIAVRTGADLVPVLAFGENNLYDQLHPNEHPFVHKIQMFILKVWKFTLPFLHGRGIFNYDVGLMPYRRPLNVVVGAPIKVTQANAVDQEEINRLHDLYVAELEKLWDRYKDEFAPDRKEEMQILS
ncbi:DAGAT-domain-containing protein [Jackrogersella minutella]|nr:DAGAT-domain-containing protein [Jackrogersella minutella]